MKEVFLGICIFLAVIVLVLGIGWIAQGNDFFMYKVFAPKQEAVRRQVFEQSKAYNQGMTQELQNMMFEYAKTKDQDSKKAMASIILHRAADYPMDKMPTDLRSFIQKLKDDEMGSN